jgi:hypothetical protein
MQFTSANYDDVSKYYRNTFIKFKDTGDTLILVQHVDRYKLTGTTVTGDEVVVYLNDEDPFEVDYVLPHKSFFQHGKDALQLHRIPAKQYQRGLTSSNTAVSFLRMSNDGTPLVQNLPVGFEVLGAFVQKQKFYSLLEAYHKKDCNSYTLSPRMMYLKANRQVYVDFVPIAKVFSVKGEEKPTIQMLKPVFLPELKELLEQVDQSSMFKVLV